MRVFEYIPLSFHFTFPIFYLNKSFISLEFQIKFWENLKESYEVMPHDKL